MEGDATGADGGGGGGSGERSSFVIGLIENRAKEVSHALKPLRIFRLLDQSVRILLISLVTPLSSARRPPFSSFACGSRRSNCVSCYFVGLLASIGSLMQWLR